jgi:hypothetical protein
MSEILTAVTVDALTGEITERNLTADEIAEREVMIAELAEREAEAQAKADARTSALAKLADLGLTQDEINAL